ncbi:hypothetical protein BO79DRAFT_82727 [Aspergillus costaricaensis CBS 115574]|uniref:Uncharacterized protein n=1 Tax=Aspergillus costaricaensis CBS 115574 TaxID=1448317 RepID=A0ACD1IL48_9EURO|nr:hypothetical protein BO79DRAFT_82727 [Aspergillus costaricaensis CBS 115574]RAK90979.1 hypothetical protein BO79DRAFT_82727 [Aspergillus costaricaensis CBS 115574]
MQNRLTEHAHTHSIIKKTVTRAQPHSVDNNKSIYLARDLANRPGQNRIELSMHQTGMKIERRLRQTSRDCCLLLSQSGWV